MNFAVALERLLSGIISSFIGIFLSLTGAPGLPTPGIVPHTPEPTVAHEEAAPKTDPETETQKPEREEAAPETRENPPPPPPAEAPPAASELIESTPPPESTPIPLSLSEVNSRAREALVNILCTTKNGALIKPITASGVFISPRGVILTNAHVGQYFLLKDYPTPEFTECIIRMGSPAYPRYRAETLFVSPAWISENATSIRLDNPLGTGENDFALLLVTGTVRSDEALPAAFPYLDPDPREEAQNAGDTAIVAGYPAGFLGGISVLRELYAVSAPVSIRELFTFGAGTADLVSIGSSVAAQKGSSGGAVVNRDGKLIGLVVTSTEGTTTEARDLRAITLFHINERLGNAIGRNLADFLMGDLAAEGATFRSGTAVSLTNLLVSELER